MVKSKGARMKVSKMSNRELADLAYDCGILVLTKMVFDVKQRKFVFDEHVLDGDLIALKQFAQEVARLEREDEF
jgi:hypothetical protein